MKRSQKELLMELIIYCDKVNCNVLSYNIGGGTRETSDRATIIDKNGGCYDLYWLMGCSKWIEFKNCDNELVCEINDGI